MEDETVCIRGGDRNPFRMWSFVIYRMVLLSWNELKDCISDPNFSDYNTSKFGKVPRYEGKIWPYPMTTRITLEGLLRVAKFSLLFSWFQRRLAWNFAENYSSKNNAKLCFNLQRNFYVKSLRWWEKISSPSINLPILNLYLASPIFNPIPYQNCTCDIFSRIPNLRGTFRIFFMNWFDNFIFIFQGLVAWKKPYEFVVVTPIFKEWS